MKRRALAAFLVIAVLAVAGILFVKSGGLESLLLQKQKVEDNSKFVYADYTFDYDGTEGGPIAMASSIAKDLGNGHVSIIADVDAIIAGTKPDSITYYDYIVCKDGKLILHEYTREAQEVTIQMEKYNLYTKVTESEREIGTYDGKKITMNDTETYADAYVSENVLHLVVNPTTSLEMTVTLKFNLEAAK